ncbi:Transducin (beta)-like 1 X-linked receptor 1 [Orbilia ellipsospora]|uniref:Transducin (Beta)-like 1 X-linked receptor 1 n=1 Tax=Orbilia ellipsospora TaxID=2528407 RepID=A0AAV9XHH5_9PEZI
MVFSSGGKHLISVQSRQPRFQRESRTPEYLAGLWSTNTRKSLQMLGTLAGYEDAVGVVGISPLGNILAFASTDGTVGLWDIVTRKASRMRVAQRLRTHIKLQDAHTRSLPRTLNEHSAQVFDVAFSPDNRLLASVSDDKTIKMWDLGTNTPIMKYSDWVKEMIFSSGSIGHTKAVNVLAFSPDGTLLASASDDGTIGLWETATRTSYRTVKTLRGPLAPANALALSPENKALAAVSRERYIIVWDLNTKKEKWCQRIDYSNIPTTKVLFSPDSKYLVLLRDKVAIVVTAATGDLTQRLAEHPLSITDLVFSSDSRFIATVSGGQVVMIWTVSDGEHIKTLQAHTDNKEPVNVSFSGDSQYINIGYKAFAFQQCEPDEQVIRASPGRIRIQQGWVTRDEERLLFLPHDHEAKCSAIHGNLVAFGHESGSISFIKFDFE